MAKIGLHEKEINGKSISFFFLDVSASFIFSLSIF